LIERIGQERFERYFLRDEALSDEECARLCGLALGEAQNLREFVNQIQIQAEFNSHAPQSSSKTTFSAVAAIEIDNGRPVLGFFHKEIWKGRYRVNEEKRELLLKSLPPKEARHAERFLKQLEFLDRRKTPLYRALETILGTQADYFITGNPDRRRLVTQRTLATKIEVTPSTLNRLISNKSVQLPWGREVPIKTLLPTIKSLLREHLHDLALKHPDFSDEGLRREMERLYGAKLSRQSVAFYRKELGLGGQGLRPRLRPRSSAERGGRGTRKARQTNTAV